ncbi:hypothetical protein [Kocuria sp.]|uniref:hypothetical protein n=1 Tax=Kocuria sp. TaxID=1871328 RepID=UPI0026DFD894|nr:hypothetical protein [Kocuria sp.]MDO5618927.1 hypothetical protein [Kocuria sp.]
MPAKAHVPPRALHGRCFTAAQAAVLGVTPRQLAGPGYRRIMRGVWATRDFKLPDHPRDRLVEILGTLQDVAPQTVASHTTAAALLGLPLPGGLWRDPGLHLTRWDGRCAPRIEGVSGHRARVAPEDRRILAGVRLTAPVLSALQVAEMTNAAGQPLISHTALVALLDGMVREHKVGLHRGMVPTCSLAQVHTDLQRFAHTDGIRRVRAALDHVQVGADSALETYARLALAAAGFTDFHHDVEIRVPGLRPVHPDLADERRRISIQIEGPHHDQSGQRIRDIERLRVTQAAGWIEIRVTAADLFVQPGQTEPRIVQLVREAIHTM